MLLDRRNAAIVVTRAVASAAMMLTAGHGFAASSLDFDKTFNSAREPAQIHFTAGYTANGAEHTLELWRDHDRLLRRRTDSSIDTLVSKGQDEVEWHMEILDLRRRIRTDIDRTNLYRIGHFVDWFGLAHVLSRPAGSYTLFSIPPLKTTRVPSAPCRWYVLTANGNSSNICWSAGLGVPVLISGVDSKVRWELRTVERKPLGDSDFKLQDEGFVRNDANADIQTD